MRHVLMAIAVMGVVLTVACSPSSDGALPVGLAPDITAVLTAGGTGQSPLVRIPKSAAQVGLRLQGELGDVEHLTAEVASQQNPDDARRWRVDASPLVNGAAAMVTLPAHAFENGDYVLNLWESDARLVARYLFRVEKP